MLEAIGLALSVRIDSGTLVFAGIDASEFPLAADLGDFNFFEVGALEFRRALEVAAVSASTDESRYLLNGVALERAVSTGSEMSPLVVIGTDGRRLSSCSIGVSFADWHGSVIVPSAGVKLISRLLPEDGIVRIMVGARAVSFALPGGGIVTVKLLEGVYPNWRQVVPNVGDAKGLCLDCEGLANAVGVAR